MTTGLFPHDNFSSVYWTPFTKLGHMIPLLKGKNPIYFGVITIIPFDNLYRRAYFVMHTFLVWRSYCPFWIKIFIHQKVCTCNSYNLNEIYSKLCMLACYHMKICILWRHFDRTIFEGVIALYCLEYLKVCMWNSSYILSGLGLWC